jgi:RNA polymerase sigma factor (sigma-70 family)
MHGVIHIAPDQHAATPAAAVGALYHRFGEDAVRDCTLRTGDRALAEDAVHEGFIQVLQRLRGGDEDLLAAHPAHVVQRNAHWAASRLMARDRSRGETLRRLDDAGVPGRDDDPWSRVEMRLELESILAALPVAQRQVLAMRYVQRLPDSLSAGLLGLSVKAFRCRVDRALSAARRVAPPARPLRRR